MTYTVARSSRGLGWNGFKADVYDLTDGYSDEFFADHSVSMHMSGPAPALLHCDGTTIDEREAPGDVRIVPSGYSRQWRTNVPTRKLLMLLEPALVDDVAASMGLPDGALLVPHLHVADKQITHIGWATAAELESDAPSRIYAESLAVALAVQLLKRFAPPVERRAFSGLSKRQLQRIVEYVKENISQDLSLTELAGIAEISASHFKVLFRESTGMPPHRYVVRARVERAVELITRTSLPLADIALQAGFASQSHLSRTVRPVYGMTPAELRRQSR